MRYYTLVGSRETPEQILLLLELIAEMLCGLGFRGRSGAAPGADSAGRRGAKRSDQFELVGFEDYLPDSKMFDCEMFGYVKPDQEQRIYDARMFDAYEQSCELAYAARGSWNGLGRNGVLLYSRNPMQVLGATLKEPSKFCVFYAIPSGKKGLVKGGTNTAVQVARTHEVPVFNLHDEAMQQRMLRWLFNNVDKLCEESQAKLRDNFSLTETEHGQANQECAVQDLPKPEGDLDRDGEGGSRPDQPHDDSAGGDPSAADDSVGRQLDDHLDGEAALPGSEVDERDPSGLDQLPGA